MQLWTLLLLPPTLRQLWRWGNCVMKRAELQRCFGPPTHQALDLMLREGCGGERGGERPRSRCLLWVSEAGRWWDSARMGALGRADETGVKGSTSLTPPPGPRVQSTMGKRVGGWRLAQSRPCP